MRSSSWSKNLQKAGTRPAPGVPIITEADDLKLLHTALRDAVLCHCEDEADRPRVVHLHLVRGILIAV